MNVQNPSPQMEVQNLVASRVRDQIGGLVLDNIRLASENEALHKALASADMEKALDAEKMATAEAIKAEDAAGRKAVKEKG